LQKSTFKKAITNRHIIKSYKKKNSAFLPSKVARNQTSENTLAWLKTRSLRELAHRGFITYVT